MPRQRLLQAIVAAIVILLGGVIFAFSGEQRTIKIEAEGEHGRAQEVTIDIDGTVEVLTVGDLADGETRTFGEGEDAIEVTRKGDELAVKTTGGELEGGRCKRVEVEVGDDDGPTRHVIVLRSDDDDDDFELIDIPHIVARTLKGCKKGAWREELAGLKAEHLARAREQMERSREEMAKLREKLERLKERLRKLDLEEQAELNEALLERLEELKERRFEIPEIPDIPDIDIDLEDLDLEDLDLYRYLYVMPKLSGHSWVWQSEGDEEDVTVFKCDKDDVTMVLPEAAAAGRTLKCPVCGEEMERAEGHGGRHRVVVRKREREAEDD